MQIAPGSIVGAKYRLEQPLSRGGMGSVWVARHVHLGSLVAIKFMDPAFASSPSFVARFEREARIAANLKSPHVVHVGDYGIDEGTPYLVMELLQGEDLGTRLQRVGRVPLQESARILAQAGRAIRRAHEAGLVHRDLKPRNLFLAMVEEEEVVKVLDFGIVKELSAAGSGEATRTGEVLGSPNYMSPEQVRGDKDVDHRSDLWSLGVILFRMLTGELPFPGDQFGPVLSKILVDPVPRPTRIAPDLPPALDAYLMRALSRDRAQRFQSMREMVDELARIAGAPRSEVASIPETFAQPAPLMAPPATVVLPRPAAPATPFLGSASEPHTPSMTAASGTLTGASGVTETRIARVRRSKAPWIIVASGAVILLASAAAIAIARLDSASPSEEPAPPSEAPAAAAPEIEAPPAAAPGIETATAAEPAAPAPANTETPAPAPPKTATAAPAVAAATKTAHGATPPGVSNPVTPASKATSRPVTKPPVPATSPASSGSNVWGL